MTYEPVLDPCRVCGNAPPHEWHEQIDTHRIAITCAVCDCLLDLLKRGEVSVLGMKKAIVGKAAIDAWRFARREQFGACMICSHGPANAHQGKPLNMSALHLHEVLNGQGNRQRAQAKGFATLVLCAWCNLYEVVRKDRWPVARQLAVLKAHDPENYDPVKFCRLRDPRALEFVTDSEVNQYSEARS